MLQLQLLVRFIVGKKMYYNVFLSFLLSYVYVSILSEKKIYINFVISLCIMITIFLIKTLQTH